VRVTDDPKPPAGDGLPPVPPPRRSRKKKRGERPDWLATSQPIPSIATSKGYLRAAGALALVGFIVFAAFQFRGKDGADPAYESPSAKIGAEGTTAVAKSRDEQRAVAAELFGSELFDVKDWEDLAEEPQWRKALEVMASLDPKFIEDHLTVSLNNSMDDVLKNPSEYRGRFVRMRGVVSRKSWGAKKLEAPLAGRIDCYRGQVGDSDDDSPLVFFDVLDKPPAFDPGYDGVEIDAMFYRTVAYETRDGKIRKAPWIVGRTVAVKNARASATSSGLGPAVMTAFLAICIGIVYLVRRGRPAKAPAGVRPAGFRDMFDRKISPNRREEPPPPPPAGD
jgi:hypothetical protein